MPYKEKEIEKKYFTIGEVAGSLKVATSLIRFWESEFDQIDPKMNDHGQKFYGSEDLAVIQKIKTLLFLAEVIQL